MIKQKPVSLDNNHTKNHSALGDVIKLTSGTTISQIAIIILSPILTHIYLPEAFGIATLFTSFINIISTIICLRFECSIILPESDEDAANQFALSLVVASLFTCILGLIILVTGRPILHLLNATKLIPYIWLFVPTVWLFGLLQALSFWVTRFKNFGQLSISRLLGSLIPPIVQLVVGFAHITTVSVLIFTSILGTSLSVFILTFSTLKGKIYFFKNCIRLDRMITGARRYKKFPLYDMWSALLNSMSSNLPTFLLQIFFSSTIVAYYSLSFRLASLPLALIGGAISQVFLQKASIAKLDGTLGKLVERLIIHLIKLCLFPMLLLAVIGRDIIMVVFGGNWAEAGVYTQILSFWLFVSFIGFPLSNLIVILEKQRFGLIFNVVLVIIRLLAFVIGGKTGNPRVALALFSGTGVITWICMCWSLTHSSGASFRTIRLNCIKSIILTILLLVSIVFLKVVVGLRPISIILISCFEVILYLVLNIWSNKSLLNAFFTR